MEKANEDWKAISDKPMYLIMGIGFLYPVCFYWFGSAFLQYVLRDAAVSIVLPALLLMLVVPVMMGIYAYDIMKVSRATGKLLGLLLLFFLYKPAYPLYRQCLLDRKPWKSMVYFFVCGMLTAGVNVRLVLMALGY